MNKTSKRTIAVLSFAVAAYAIVAYSVLPLGATLHPDVRPSFASHPVAVVYLHVFCGSLALLLGPLQFWTTLRRRHPVVHRWLGAAYLALGIGAGGLSGFAMALDAYGGGWARAGFGTLAVLWLVTGAVALVCILRGKVQAHRRWMTHNFALTLAAVALRLYLPASVGGGLALDVAYPIVAWLCWAPHLVVAEWLLRRAELAAHTPTTHPAAGHSTPVRPAVLR